MHIPSEALSAYLDERLSHEEHARIEAHLRVCTECRRELAELRWTVMLLQTMPDVALPRPFYVRVTDLTPPRPRWHRWILHWRPVWRMARYAGAALLVLLIFLDIFTLGRTGGDVAFVEMGRLEETSAAMPAEAEQMERVPAMAEMAAEEAPAEKMSVPEAGAQGEEEIANARTVMPTEVPPPDQPEENVVSAPSSSPTSSLFPLATVVVAIMTLLAILLDRWSSRWEPND